MALKESLERLSQQISSDLQIKDELSNAIIKDIIDGLVITKRWTLVDIIEQMGFLLVHQDPKERAKGVKILGLLIKLLPSDHLSSKEVDHLCLFLCDRLKDHPDVVPQAILSLVFLTAHKNLPQDFALRVFNTLVKEVTVPLLKITDRYACYQLVKFLVIDHYEELKSIGLSSVQGWIQMIEGESDPRCLLIIFPITEYISQNYTLDPLTEDLFEVVSCYFPVTFKPPEDDEYGITRDDLVNGLIYIFKATNRFAEFCIPFMLEKLESEIQATKLDSYGALIECLPKYSASSVKPFAEPLWTCIRIDSLRPETGNDTPLSRKALETLSALCKTLAAEQEALDNLAEKIWHDINPAFKKPELGLLNSATKIFANLANHHGPSMKRVHTELIPSLAQRVSFMDMPTHRRSCFKSLSLLVTLNSQLEQEVMDSFITTSLSIASNDHENEDLRFSALQTIEAFLANIPQLSTSLVLATLIAENLLSLALNPHESPLITNQARITLGSLRTNQEVFVNVIVRKLKDTLVRGVEQSEEPMRSSFLALDSLRQLANEKQVRDHTAQPLIELLSDLSISASEGSLHEALGIGIGSCLKTYMSLSPKEDPTPDDKSHYFEPISQQIIHCTLCTDRVTKSGRPSLPNLTILHHMCLELLPPSIQRLPSDEIANILDNELVYFLDGAVEQVLKVVPPSCFCKFTPGPGLIQSLNERAVTVTLLHLQAVILSSFPVLEPDLTSPRFLQVLGKLKDFALDLPLDDMQQEIVAQIIALFVFQVGKRTKTADNPLAKEASSLYDSLDHPRKFRLFKWIFKALVLAGAPYTGLVELAMQSIENPHNDVGENLVELFPFILDSDNVIEAHLPRQNIHPLYRQKFWTITFDKLWNAFNIYNPENAAQELAEANAKIRARASAAILGQLKLLPETIYRDYLEKLLPILLYSLKTSKDSSIQNVTLQSLCHLIGRNPDQMKSYMDTLVQECVHLAASSPSLVVRRSACENLSLMPQKFDPFGLMPHRLRVVKGLKPVLDDRKRLVRQKAVEARCRWISLGQPGAG